MMLVFKQLYKKKKIKRGKWRGVGAQDLNTQSLALESRVVTWLRVLKQSSTLTVIRQDTKMV